MSFPDRPPVDTRRARSVEFAPPQPPATEGNVARSLIAVGPGRPTTGPTDEVPEVERPVGGYPIQPAKVQRPALREETLSRERLLDWLRVKVHHRVVHVLAEAGYGKTTLLADFARQTRLRTLWYRLGSEDRNWVAFLSYLVAAGQAQQASFAPATSALLREVDAGGPSLDDVLESFLRELEPLSEAGALIILDDYHLVDEAPDVRHIMRTLMDRAPERVSFVFSSRRAPGLPVGRLRAQGEVAELHTDDLRFSADETERLFRDTYRRPLEADVLTDLSERTEGWAASLQLVNSAIQARTASEVRAFVRSLSGAEGDLYDYLAEEVIGTLAAELQQFLMRVAVLQELDPSLMETATGLPATEVARLAADGERCGLLVRGHDGPASRRCLHPLVRQFLLHRLERQIGAEGVRELHTAIATKHFDRWTVACHHFAQARAVPALHRCLEASVRRIFGAGNMPIAAAYLERYRPSTWTAPLAMLSSRAEFMANRPDQALRQAELAVDMDASPHAVQNLAAIHMLAGDMRKALTIARDASVVDDEGVAELLSTATEMLQATVDGYLPALVGRLTLLAESQAAEGLTRYFGISMLNVALVHRAQGDAAACVARSLEAELALEQSAAAEELLSARLARFWAVAHLETLEAAEHQVSIDLDSPNQDVRAEMAAELASTHIWFGDTATASALLATASASVDRVRPSIRNVVHLARAELSLRSGDFESAEMRLNAMRPGPSGESAHQAHQLAVRAYLAVLRSDGAHRQELSDALDLAARQGAQLWWTYSKLIEALATNGGPISLPPDAHREGAYLSMLAELVTRRLHVLGSEDRDAVRRELRRRPARWRRPLREAVVRGDPSRWAAAECLNEIGEREDVPHLRALARSSSTRSHHRALGRELARRLAPRLTVEDLGRVRLTFDARSLDGAGVRRKVLALLCFLVSRPNFSATRDEVLDGLWPDLTPVVAANSLNQTVYFLRRVIEPEYAEETSAGYVHLESNVLWLDQELVGSRSSTCWSIIKAQGARLDSEAVVRLSELYTDKFALDFAYEEWALSFRETLHAAYLQLVETAVKSDIDAGHFNRAAALGRRAILVDPKADALEGLLVRLYRLTGAHAAAAEQYAHYAAALRQDFGVEPAPLDAL